MPKVTFKREDFLQKSPLDPGWYPLIVGEFTDSLAKNGDSTNFWAEFSVADGPKAGTPIRHCFNEKGISMPGGAADFVMCFTKDAENKLEGTDVLEVLQQTTGRKVEGHCRFDPERRYNVVEDFRPVRS